MPKVDDRYHFLRLDFISDLVTALRKPHVHPVCGLSLLVLNYCRSTDIVNLRDSPVHAYQANGSHRS